MREALRSGTIIKISEGEYYKITDELIGSGGGSLVYACVRLTKTEQGYEDGQLKYVLKECFPLSPDHTFLRKESGQITADQEDADALHYLETVKRMQLQEQEITNQIYQKGFRLIPIISKSERVGISFDAGDTFSYVDNTMTVMESLDDKGRSLGRHLKENGGKLPVNLAFHVIQQVLYAVMEVHEAGFLHLDIQDGNLFIKGSLSDQNDMISLIDFGTARKCMPDGYTDVIADKVLFSTRGFSAPEMHRENDGSLRLGPEADIYSIGYVLLLMLTGIRYDENMLAAAEHGHFITGRKMRKIGCPGHMQERMQEILARALAEKAEDRYHSCKEMIADVTDFLAALNPYRSDLTAATYDAFICYRHGNVDSKAALALQKNLENFGNTSLFKKNKQKKINHVFVDEGELSSCADFGLQIREALKNSGWLIVICSPETKESPWVNLEISTFLEFHDRSRILAVLTEGEPEDVFPDLLLGESQTDMVLAADARDKNPEKVLKKLKGDALYKIAAPILGTTFDSLKQRKKRYQMQRIAIATSFVFLLTAAFTAYVVMQNRSLDQALQQQLLEQSKYLTKEAETYMDEGNNAMAVKYLLQALPSEGNERPYYPKAQYQLTKALNLYSYSGEKADIVADSITDSTSELSATLFTDDTGEYLFGKDADLENIYVWNTEEMSLQTSIKTDGIGKYDSSILLPEHRMVIGSYEGITCYDYLTAKALWTYSFEDDNYESLYTIMIPSDMQDILYFIEGDQLVTLNSSDGSVTGRITMILQEGGALSVSGFEGFFSLPIVSSDGRYLVFVTGDTNKYIRIYDVKSETFVTSLPVLEENHYKMSFFSDNGLIIMADNYHKYTVTISAMNLDKAEVLWEKSDVSYTYNCELDLAESEEGDSVHLVFAKDSKVSILDEKNGDEKGSFLLDSYIKGLWCTKDNMYSVSYSGNLYSSDYKEYVIYANTFPEGWNTITPGKDADQFYCIQNSYKIATYMPEKDDPNRCSVKSGAEINIFDDMSLVSSDKWSGYMTSNEFIFFNTENPEIQTADSKLFKIYSEEDGAWEDVYLIKMNGDIAYFITYSSNSNDFTVDVEDSLVKYKYIITLFSYNMLSGEVNGDTIYESDQYVMDYSSISGYDSDTDKLYVYAMSQTKDRIQGLNIYDFNRKKWDFWEIPDLKGTFPTVVRSIKNSIYIIYDEENNCAYILNLKKHKIQMRIELSDYPEDYLENYLQFNHGLDVGENYAALTDGTSIVVYTSDGKIKYRIDCSQEESEGKYPQIQFSADDKYLYYILGNEVSQVELSSGKILQTLEIPDYESAYSHAYSSDSETIYVRDYTKEKVDIYADEIVHWYLGDSDDQIVRFYYYTQHRFYAFDFNDKNGSIITDVENALFYDPDHKRIFTYSYQDDTYQLAYFPEYTQDDILEIANEKYK